MFRRDAPFFMAFDLLELDDCASCHSSNASDVYAS
jgi:hypothetical protein